MTVKPDKIIKIEAINSQYKYTTYCSSCHRFWRIKVHKMWFLWSDKHRFFPVKYVCPNCKKEYNDYSWLDHYNEGKWYEGGTKSGKINKEVREEFKK